MGKNKTKLKNKSIKNTSKSKKILFENKKRFEFLHHFFSKGEKMNLGNLPFVASIASSLILIVNIKSLSCAGRKSLSF